MEVVYVVDIGTDGVLAVDKSGNFTWLRTREAKTLALGATLQSLGREVGYTGGVGRFGRHTDVQLVDATELRVGATNLRAARDAMRGAVHSGSGPYRVGRPIALLEEWARLGVVEGDTPESYWSWILTLPGNRHREFATMALYWGPLFAAALRVSTEPTLSRELLARREALFRALLDGSKKVQGNAYRRFVVEVGGAGALSCLAAHDRACARAWIEMMSAPPRFPSDIAIEPENDQRYFESRIRPFQNLIDALEGRPVTRKSDAFELQLFEDAAKAFPAPAVEEWRRALRSSP